jgi:hypothetical protein
MIAVFPRVISSTDSTIPEWRMVPNNVTGSVSIIGSVVEAPSVIVVEAQEPVPRYLNRKERRAQAAKSRHKAKDV